MEPALNVQFDPILVAVIDPPVSSKVQLPPTVDLLVFNAPLEFTVELSAVAPPSIFNISVEKVCEHCNGKTGKQCDKTARVQNESGLHLCSTHKLLKMYKNTKNM
mgnify:CR=1 FL=1